MNITGRSDVFRRLRRAIRLAFHASSFYEQQGFMEGAALSGQRAARNVYRLLRG